MFEHPPIDWDQVRYIHVVSDGTQPPAFHVRDQERRDGALPPCELAPADRSQLSPVRLASCPATLWLPAVEVTAPMDVPPRTPAGTPQGWEWPSGAWLYLAIDTDPLLPDLHALTGGAADAQCAVVAGRPMRLERRGPTEPGADHGGWVQGFLGERLQFFAQVSAPSAAERDALLCAVLTVTPDAGTGGEATGALTRGGG